ncbi:carbohydrate ABC transporter permease [Neobacillus sp. CF12]|uniref:carbohydrate ABC transporter permease n=1 Tax=Neobacillus sp. CF12 TaxID=3055864 RepID=UPI0025A014AA|nr:carbohydrate ABC transporter permease [Neobacillus sp. CF12]MDM5328435.1 carbohydrate ABC transporter permease [Neobacillus sp. CF12]
MGDFIEKNGLKITYTVASILALLWVIPLIWVLLVSFKASGSLLSVVNWLKPPFSIENYVHVFSNAPVLLWLWNSFLVSTITTVFVLILSGLAAFPFSINRFPGSRILFWIILAGLMVPGEAILVPLYILLRDLNLLDTYSSLILPVIAVPFGMIFLKQFFDGLPKELYEAAKIDGCGMYRMLFLITLPLSRSAIAALGIFTFLSTWKEFLWPFISITSADKMTIPVGIPFFNSGFVVDYTIPMAANVIVSIPVLIVFLIFQKQIIKGISFTGIK